MSSRKVDADMGFRNIREFNLSLLGKQAWRLLANPEKLVSKIFKARYYPSESFLTVKIGSSPSYIWRSVFETQDFIMHNISCCIGNGDSIFIINTPWLPYLNEPCVESSNESLLNQKVSLS